MDDLIADLCKLHTYDLECHGYFGDELVRKEPISAEDLTRNLMCCGDFCYVEDVIEILRKHHLLTGTT